MDECKANPSWMLVNCPVACEQCGVTCEDNSVHCEKWAQTGECSKNAEYMNIYCAKVSYPHTNPPPNPGYAGLQEMHGQDLRGRELPVQELGREGLLQGGEVCRLYETQVQEVL